MDGDPFRLLLRPGIVLSAAHPIVVRARERAQTAPALAATLLARAILVARGALDPTRDAALTERGIATAMSKPR